MKTIQPCYSIAHPTPLNPKYEEYITKDFIKSFRGALEKWSNQDYRIDLFIRRANQEYMLKYYQGKDGAINED